MQAEYRREMNHSYLVLKAGGTVNPQGYEIIFFIPLVLT